MVQPVAEDLNEDNVPNAQQPMHDNKKKKKAEYRNWASKVTKGVTDIMNSRRANVMSHKAKLDLCTCMNLLDGTLPLPFIWDTGIYINPGALRLPRLPTAKVGSLPGDKTYREEVYSDDDDDDLLDPIARPQWSMGQVRIVKLPTAPFWTMARCLFFIC